VFVNNFSAAEKVLHRDPSLVNSTKPDTTTPLHVAAAEGHVDVANVFIKVCLQALTLLVGWQKGHPACKQLSDGMLDAGVVCLWVKVQIFI